MVTLHQHTSLEVLANKFLDDVLLKDNFSGVFGKGGFLTGGNLIVCESKGLQEYLRKTCVDKHGIWTALTFKPLAGLLMQCAYNLSEEKLDEKENVYNPHNLVWAIYRLLEDEKKTFFFANELASLFFAYQIYRPELIEKWNKGEPYEIKNLNENFKRNEKFQRELWIKIKKKHKNKQDIYQLYKSIKDEASKGEKKTLQKKIFVFAPLSIAPLHLSTLTYLTKIGYEINLYVFQISEEYIGASLSDKKITKEKLYCDFGNRLIANLGRTAQTFQEQLLTLNLNNPENSVNPENSDSDKREETLLSKIQNNIIQDNEKTTECPKDTSLTFNNCFSPLREIEVLSDYILDLFAENKNLTPADIAVVSPNIENYASAIETVFGRYEIPYKIADRDVKKYDKTTQLLNMLFSLINSRYEAPDVVALFEYSIFVQGKELEPSDRERLEKWVRENAIRYGLQSDAPKPNYSFESGFEQLAAGFFMISENGFSEKGDYCYPDIEGSSAKILGDFIDFAKTLQKFEKLSEEENSIDLFKENLLPFFGEGETNFIKDSDEPYQKIIKACDSLKKEISIGFGEHDTKINFAIFKKALLSKMESSAKSSFSMEGKISFSNFETIRAVPHKVLCCIGMNCREFPRQIPSKEISLIAAECKPNDKDTANEDRLMFLETIRSAKEKLYISWIGQNEKNSEELDPSSAVTMLLKNLKVLITKHPLQPFSKKYFNGNLSTYDNRWHTPRPSGTPLEEGKNNIWQWEIKFAEIEESRDINTLYRILSDAPKYFLRDVCKIELPEEIDVLKNIEPLVIEKGLDEWKLADLILNNKEDYKNKIKISKLRGSLPSGKFAEKMFAKKEEQLKEMQGQENPNVKTFIKPSKDKGKYRLWHWLQHLEYNRVAENSETEIILLDNHIKLLGLQKNEAENAIEKLWNLAGKLKTRMYPIFPDAAWGYLTGKKIFEDDYIEKMAKYSQYAKMVLKNMESLKDLDVGEFEECSKRLFEGYNNSLVS